jgi:hypothetical protein
MARRNAKRNSFSFFAALCGFAPLRDAFCFSANSFKGSDTCVYAIPNISAIYGGLISAWLQLCRLRTFNWPVLAAAQGAKAREEFSALERHG